VSCSLISQKVFMLGNSAVRTTNLSVYLYDWLIDAQSVLMFIIPTVLIQYVTIRQTVHTQYFIIIIHKATCFDCTIQPSTDFTFHKYMICESTSGYCEQRVSPAPVFRTRQRSLVRITQCYAAAGLRLEKDSGYKTNTKNFWAWQLCFSRIPRLQL
jgi:hypothetical protein